MIVGSQDVILVCSCNHNNENLVFKVFFFLNTLKKIFSGYFCVLLLCSFAKKPDLTVFTSSADTLHCSFWTFYWNYCGGNFYRAWQIKASLASSLHRSPRKCSAWFSFEHCSHFSASTLSKEFPFGFILWVVSEFGRLFWVIIVYI